jgi:hypothetical protein
MVFLLAFYCTNAFCSARVDRGESTGKESTPPYTEVKMAEVDPEQGFTVVTSATVFYLTSNPGDFSLNGIVDAADIDILSRHVAAGSGELAYDLSGDGVLDDADRVVWVHEIAGTFFGDADLDKTVSYSDFLALAASFGTAGEWSTGDFSGNSHVGFDDFVLMSENYGRTSVAAAAVPEPSVCSLLAMGLAGLAALRKRRASHC